MANTVSIDALRQELWGKELFDDVARDVKNVLKFVGEDENNIVQVNRDLMKKGGDTATFGLMAQLTGDAVLGDDELEGNEDSALTYSQSVSIDQARKAVRTKGKLDLQKVTYDSIKEYRKRVQLWMKQFMIRQIFLKAGGVTNTTLVDTNGVVYSKQALFSNTPAFIPDADEAAGTGARYICSDTAGTDALGSTDTMTLDLVTKAATVAELASPGIQKIDQGGDEFWVMFMHPLQARDIKLSSDWKTAQQNARDRGDSNPVFKGALGFWSNVLLLSSEYVPWLDISVSGNSFRGAATGTDCTFDCARALLFGRQAVVMAEASNPEALVVSDFDYKNKTGVAGSFMGGIQKSVFNSKEFGVVAVDTAAAV